MRPCKVFKRLSTHLNLFWLHLGRRNKKGNKGDPETHRNLTASMIPAMMREQNPWEVFYKNR